MAENYYRNLRNAIYRLEERDSPENRQALLKAMEDCEKHYDKEKMTKMVFVAKKALQGQKGIRFGW